MRYQVGSPGRIIIVQFDDRDDMLEHLVSIARKEDIRAAVFSVVGGMREGDIVVGPEKDELPPQPVWKQLGESHETVGLGTIFWEGDEPKVHFHGVFGKKDMVKAMSEVFLILEAVIIEIQGVSAARELDPATGMALLKLH
jgi:predicted DNA-binding protein with PD1-like motif